MSFWAGLLLQQLGRPAVLDISAFTGAWLRLRRPRIKERRGNAFVSPNLDRALQPPHHRLPANPHLESDLNRYITLYTSSAMVYGRGGAFSFNLVPPPGDSKVDRRSLFSWHFEALRRGMLESKDDLARALSVRR